MKHTTIRALALVIVATLGLGLLTAVGPVPRAQAATAFPTTPNATPLPTVQIDGVVWQTLTWGDTVYAAGSFTTARPPGAAPGVGTVQRLNLLAFDVRTGALREGFVADANAQVLALAMAPDGSRLFVGGEFTTINGINRFRIAALNPTTGAVDTSFRSQTDFRVRSIVATDAVVYAGGAFGVANTQPRAQLAAFDRRTGELLNWAPTAAGGQVMSMALLPGSDRLVVSGAFSTLNGIASPGMGALDLVSGATMDFPINRVISNSGTSAAIYSLTTSANRIYGVGYTFGAGGNFEGTFATDPAGRIGWINDSRGDQYDVHSARGLLFSVGHAYTSANVPGGYPNDNRRPWYTMAATAEPTGTVATTNNGRTNFGGNPAPTVLHWWPEFTAGTFTGSTQGPWSAGGDDRYVVLGGEFTRVNLVNQQGLVRFAFRDVAASTEPPRLSGTSFLPEVTSPAAGTAQVSFRANWDRDDAELTYQIQREGAGTIATTTARSTFHTLPVTTHLDRGLAPGSTHRYRIVAVDALGLRAVGGWVPVTISATGTLSPYAAAVLASGPSSLWRLSDTGTALSDSAFTNDGAVTTGVVRGVEGALAGDPDTATRFAGAGQNAWQSVATSPVRELSSEIWFRTTTTNGGALMSFGSQPGTQNSGTVDYVTYLGNDGRVRFGVVENTRRVVASPKAYNDGRWHHVVATIDWAGGQRLYVDGELVGSNPGVKHGRDLRGHWRVGGDQLTNYPDRPRSDFISADLDEAAVYPFALTPERVAEHHRVGSGAAPAPNADPSASFTATVTDLRASFDGRGSSDPDGTIADYAWTFGDGTSATGPVVDKDYATPGTFGVTLTVTDDRGAIARSTRSVTTTAPPADTSVLAADPFDRSLAMGWGTAATGGTWTLFGSAAGYRVVGGQGEQLLTAPGAKREARLPIGATDVDVTTVVSLDKPAAGGAVLVVAGARSSATGAYLARLRYNTDGTVALNTQRVLSGTATTLSGGTLAGVTATPGAGLHLRLRVTGTGTATIAAKAWPVGTPEPAAWTTTAADSTAALQGPGALLLEAYLSTSATNAPVAVRFDDVRAVPVTG
jgi:hypothetical protein